MRGKLIKKALAVATAFLMLSGGVSVQPFADIFKDTAITASAQGTNVDLSTLTGGYTAQDGDVLTGSTSHTVTIADNAKITLSNATINGGIICDGSATISVEGSNNVTGLVYHAGIRVGAPDTTLTINGNGVLNATGGNQGAGIGLDSSYDSNTSQSGGNIVIEGGTINATGVAQAAGIGCGNTHYSKPVTIGDITIKGGTVTAVAQDTAGGYGIGKTGKYTSYQTTGTITITTGITSVDASGYAGSFSENIVYKDGDVDVTASKDTYFTIYDEEKRRLISTNFSYYNVSIEDNITHGTVTASQTSAISGASITLSATPNDGYRLKSITVKDSAQNTISLNGMSFMMPADNVTVSAVFEEIPITQTSYIDADGNERTVTASVLDADTTELTEGWYVVNSTFTNPNKLKPSGDVNIILVDDCTMNLGQNGKLAFSGAEETTTNLTIYGQSKGTGKLVLSQNDDMSVYIKGSLTINGGTWTSQSVKLIGTDQNEECLTFNGGNINIGGFFYSIDISKGKCSINGGQVNLTSVQNISFRSDNTISLGYTKATDLIYTRKSLSDDANVRIADGMVFTDGTNIYDSNTPSETLRALSSVTLTPANTHNITAAPAENGTVTANEKEFEDDTVTLTVTPDTGYAVKSVKYNDTEITPVNGVYSFEMPAEDVTVTAEFKRVYSDGIGEHLAGHSLSLNGNIGVNFYMELDADVIADPDAYMLFTLPNGTTQTVKVSDATVDTTTVSGKTYYVFQCSVAAKEMTDTIKAQMFSGEKQGEEYSYTVKQYADYLFANAYEADGTTVKNQAYVDAIELIKSMVNYGAYSQLYFNHNIDSPANADITATNVSGVTAETVNKTYDGSTNTLPDGVTLAGANLELESETVMNLYFTNTTGKALTFTTSGNVALVQEQSGEYTTVTITGIAAQYLDSDVTVNVALEGDDTAYSVKYSPMNYCYNVLARETSATRTEALKDVMRAFYLYNKEAKAYFASHNN